MSSNQYLFSQSTKRYIKNFLCGAVSVIVATVFLVNCGGGGGDGGSTTESVAPVLNPGIVGKLWHPDEGITTREYITNVSTGGTNVKVLSTGYSLASVARDGRILVSQEILSRSGSANLQFHDATKINEGNITATVLKSLPIDEELNFISISPDSRYLALIYADGIPKLATKNGLWVFDLQNQSDVRKINPVQIRKTNLSTNQVAAFDWLPGGEYLYMLDNDERLIAGSAANPKQSDRFIGKISRPPGYSIVTQRLAISPDGKQIALTFSNQNIAPNRVEPDSDVWLSDINGGNLQRLTSDNKSSHPIWSSDGKFIILGSNYHETAGTPRAGQPGFGCETWYVPSTAKNTTFEQGQKLRYTDFEGTVSVGMSCILLADFRLTQ
jgi:hypothetical protein